MLKQLGCDVEIIDYRCKAIEEAYHVKRLHECNNLVEVMRWALYARNQRLTHKKFDDFRKHYLKLSRPYNSHEELAEAETQYDKLICGSDQVWNYEGSNFDKAFFLSFGKGTIERNAYAASFGFSTLPKEYEPEYAKMLGLFRHISVREAQGADIIKMLLNRDVEVVLDPTLLLNEAQWSSLTKHTTIKKEYVLLYCFELTPTLKQFTMELAAETNCEIRYISYALRKQINAIHERCIGPLEFLGLILNAKYVVTNSFHGTAFAINFRKACFVELLQGQAKVNSRIEYILERFGLASRKIISGRKWHFNEPIDYVNVHALLEADRIRSMTYLKRILGE